MIRKTISPGALCKDGEQGVPERGRRLQSSYHMRCRKTIFFLSERILFLPGICYDCYEEVKPLSGKRQDNFWDEFWGEYRLSSEEKRAVRKEIPMTENLLFSIIAKLDFWGMYDQIVQLTNEYESLFLQGTEKAIQNSESIPLPEAYQPQTAEETRIAYDELMERIRTRLP